jgi:uncharacterized membrane protein YkvA (DUF1232 family)
MSAWQWLLIAFAITLALYAAFVPWLLVAGRRGDARAVAGFIPDCLVLFRGLLGDARVPRSRKLLLVALVAYLAAPIDLIPDFIPVAGQLDDAILVAAVTRSLLRASGPDLIQEHWPGPQRSLQAVLDVAGWSPGRRRDTQPPSGCSVSGSAARSRCRSASRRAWREPR